MPSALASNEAVRRVCPKKPARRLVLIGLCTVTALVAAAGLAWACAPSGGVTGATPASGPAGTLTTVTGDGAAGAASVDIHWETKTGPMLRGNVPINGAGPNSIGGFSAQVTIPASAGPGVHHLLVVQRRADGTEVVAPQSQVAIFEVTDPSLALTPAVGPSGTRTTVTGTAFATVTVKLRWDSPTGPELASTTGPSFSTQVTIPSAASGNHSIFAVPSINSADRASAVFRITAPLLEAVAPLDNVGPAIAGASLTRENGTRTVSRKGEVRVFCGRFTEPGVAGVCSARSARALRIGKVKASRAVVLRLGAKRFRAQPGQRVTPKFRLSKSSLKLLKAAKKVRMRGTVEARDAKGNLTKAPFRFTLKAPTAR